MNIEKEELIRQLKIAEPYNNKDIPQYVWNIINAIPDAERTGEWIEDSDWWYQTRYRCSECGKYVSNMSNYCFDCGARMVSEK